MELVVLVTALVMLAIVPFGAAGACFAVWKFIKRRQRLQRYAIEFHTVLLTLIVVTGVVPLTNSRLVLSILKSDSIRSVKIFHTVTMQILQVVQLCNVIIIALKRARTMTRSDRQPNVSAEVASIIICWVFGVAVGVTPTATALTYYGNSTDDTHDHNSSLRHRTCFDAIYLGLLLMTSLVMFVSYLSVRRYINSTIASSTADGRSLIDRVYTIGALAKGLGDNLALQFVTANGRRTTVINSPVMDDENGVVTSKVVVDNWISEKPTTERYKSTATTGTASFDQNQNGLKRGTCPGSPRRPDEDCVSFSLINIPILGSVNNFDAIREETDEDERDTAMLSDDELIERLSLTICAHPRQDNLGVVDRCSSRIDFPGMWEEEIHKSECSDRTYDCSVSSVCRLCDDNERASVSSHCKHPGHKSPRYNTPCESDDGYVEMTEGNTPPCKSHSRLAIEKSTLNPSRKNCISPTNSFKRCLSPCRHLEDGDDHDNASVSSRSSVLSTRGNSSLVSPTWSNKCCDILSISSDLLHPSGQPNGRQKRNSSNSDDSTFSLPPLKHTRSSPSSISLRSPTSLLRRSSSIRQLFNGKKQPSVEEKVGATDNTIPENNLSWASYHNKERGVSVGKDDIPYDERPEMCQKSGQTDTSTSNVSAMPPCLACQSGSLELERDEKFTYEKHAVESSPPAVQIRVTRPSTEAVRFLSRRNGLVQELPRQVIGRQKNVLDYDYRRKQSVINPATCSSKRRIISSDPGLFSGSSSRSLSLQRGNINNHRVPFRHKTLQYKETIVRRFVLAFVMNVITQIPNVALEISHTSEVTYCILSPIFQSIALSSFLLSPYIYVLGNKIIHKTMTMRRLH